MAVSALLLLIPALAVSAAMDRSTWRVYAAVVAGVAAAYVTLFELGRGRQGHPSALGVLASLLAVACWGIERMVSRWAREEWRDLYAAPLANATIALALLAIVPEWDSPRALLLASVPFLLLIQSRPRAGWLYPALGLMVASSAFAIVHRWGPDALMPASVAGAFVLWGLGLAIWRWKPALCRRLRLVEDLGYEFPPYHAAMALGATALGLWLDTIFQGRGSWSSGAWVPAAVAVLSLLMLKPYPHRGWVDGFAGLMSLAVLAACGASLTNPLAWALVVLSLALLWRMAQWVASPLEEGVRQRLGIGFAGVADVLGLWSLGLLAAGTLPLVVRLGGSVLATTLGVHDASAADDPDRVVGGPAGDPPLRGQPRPHAADDPLRPRGPRTPPHGACSWRGGSSCPPRPSSAGWASIRRRCPPWPRWRWRPSRRGWGSARERGWWPSTASACPWSRSS